MLSGYAIGYITYMLSEHVCDLCHVNAID